jgi:hypothetical protein
MVIVFLVFVHLFYSFKPFLLLQNFIFLDENVSMIMNHCSVTLANYNIGSNFFGYSNYIKYIRDLRPTA